MKALLIILFLTSVSCNLLRDDDEQTPKSLIEFVNSENLPKKQKIEIFLDLEADDFIGFSVQYGNANDCPSGCFYSIATGFKLDDKIGWIDVQDYDENDISDLTYFEIEKTDSLFYTEPFWNELENSNPWIYLNAFLPKLNE